MVEVVFSKVCLFFVFLSVFFYKTIYLPAFETLPIESMECLEIGGRGNLLGQPKSPYAMDMDVGEIGAGDLSFDNLDSMPSPQDGSWYNQR